MSHKLPAEAVAAQVPSYVTYIYPPNISIAPRVTILESPQVIAASGTTGRRTWEAGLHLSKYLVEKGSSMVSGKRILELGAGTGLVSILCARWLGATHVTATDGDDTVLDDLQKNVFLNELEDTGLISTKTYKWGQNMEEDESGHAPLYDVVLGGDIVSLINDQQHMLWNELTLCPDI